MNIVLTNISSSKLNAESSKQIKKRRIDLDDLKCKNRGKEIASMMNGQIITIKKDPKFRHAPAFAEAGSAKAGIQNH